MSKKEFRNLMILSVLLLIFFSFSDKLADAVEVGILNWVWIFSWISANVKEDPSG